MRWISPCGTAWIIVAVMVAGAVLHSPVAAMAAERAKRPPPGTFVFTPQRPTPKTPTIDAFAAFAAKVKQGSFALVLNDGNRYIWTPATDQKLPLEAAFASVEVPLALVASVSFTDEQGAIKVAFRNGDVLTGRLLLKQLAIHTAYGDLTVPISAMTFLGAGGVTRPAAVPQVTSGPPSDLKPSVLPPRPVPAARFDRLRR